MLAFGSLPGSQNIPLRELAGSDDPHQAVAEDGEDWAGETPQPGLGRGDWQCGLMQRAVEDLASGLDGVGILDQVVSAQWATVWSLQRTDNNSAYWGVCVWGVT